MSRKDRRKSSEQIVKNIQRDIRRRAKRNRQNPRTGQPTRPAKKQGCLSMSAVIVLGVASAVIAIKTGVS